MSNLLRLDLNSSTEARAFFAAQHQPSVVPPLLISVALLDTASLVLTLLFQ